MVCYVFNKYVRVHSNRCTDDIKGGHEQKRMARDAVEWGVMSSVYLLEYRRTNKLDLSERFIQQQSPAFSDLLLSVTPSCFW